MKYHLTLVAEFEVEAENIIQARKVTERVCGFGSTELGFRRPKHNRDSVRYSVRKVSERKTLEAKKPVSLLQQISMQAVQLDSLKAERDALAQQINDLADSRQAFEDVELLLETYRAREAKLSEAIRIHSECVTVCDHCGWETPNDTDDVCAALASTTPEVKE